MIIYKLTNRMTGMSYVGATTQSLPMRCSQHRKAAAQNHPYPIAQAIREHGWAAFDVGVLNHANTRLELNVMERAAIALFQTITPNGYNLTPGGPGSGKASIATRQKLSAAGKGKTPWNKGVPHTPEAKAKVSESRRGAKNWGARPILFDGNTYVCIKDAMEATGYSRAQIVRRIAAGRGRYLSASRRKPDFGRWLVGRIASAETRRKMSAARSGANHYRARAIEIDGKAYPSITDASRLSGYSYMQLKTRLADGRAKYLTASRYVHND